jgi:ABC-2 type transport system permease protein
MQTLHRISHIALKEFLELWRHAGIVALVLLIPVAEVIVLGYATSGSVINLPAGVYDADHTTTSRRLITAIDEGRGFDVTHLPHNLAQAETMLNRNQISAFFVIPAGFEQKLAHPEGQTVVVAATIDGSNTAVANYTATYAQGVMSHFITHHLDRSQPMPVTAQTRLWYNQELRRENFYVTGLLGTMLALVVLAITAVSIVRERERGTLEQLMVSPTRPVELIAGKLAPIILIGYFELVAMLLISIWIFNISVKGSLALYMVLMMVYMLTEMGIGILISTLSRNQAQALPSIFLLVTVYGILGGFITPVETMPPAARWASNLIPLKYFINITRELFAKGADLPTLVPQLIPLIVMSGILFTVSILLLRRRLV